MNCAIKVWVLFLLCLIPNNSQSDITKDYKFSKTYKSTPGPVNFNHQRHVETSVKDCGPCHSALKTFGGEVSELFAHNFCKICHEARNGPTECTGCHEESRVSMK